MQTQRTRSALVVLSLLVALPVTGWAQADEERHQEYLTISHGVLQKTGLGTLAMTGAIGVALMANKATLFSDGLCAAGNPVFGQFGCDGSLSLLHFGFAATTLGLFVTSEIIATQLEVSPYEVADPMMARTRRALLWTNVALFSVQPVLGLLSAHPALIGIPPDALHTFSRVLRTVHFGVGLGVATTYTLHAAFQW
jgi:hypothetical protein